MKRVTILVLLVVMAGGVAVLDMSSGAQAGEWPEYALEEPTGDKIDGGLNDLSGKQDDDDDGEGDPGDAGDGYGIADKPDFLEGASAGRIEVIWEEMWIFLMIHLQLLP
jgi:hypothetical protein